MICLQVPSFALETYTETCPSPKATAENHAHRHPTINPEEASVSASSLKTTTDTVASISDALALPRKDRKSVHFWLVLLGLVICLFLALLEGVSLLA